MVFIFYDHIIFSMFRSIEIKATNITQSCKEDLRSSLQETLLDRRDIRGFDFKWTDLLLRTNGFPIQLNTTFY